MKMTQQEMADYTAHRLATACERNEENLRRMRSYISDIETCDRAIASFAGNDWQAHDAVVTMRGHHLIALDGKHRSPRFHTAGADATWQMTKRSFDRQCRADQFLPCDQVREYMVDMGRHFKSNSQDQSPRNEVD